MTIVMKALLFDWNTKTKLVKIEEKNNFFENLIQNMVEQNNIVRDH